MLQPDLTCRRSMHMLHSRWQRWPSRRPSMTPLMAPASPTPPPPARMGRPPVATTAAAARAEAALVQASRCAATRTDGSRRVRLGKPRCLKHMLCEFVGAVSHCNAWTTACKVQLDVTVQHEMHLASWHFLSSISCLCHLPQTGYHVFVCNMCHVLTWPCCV